MRPRDLAILFALAAVWGASFLFIRIAAPAFGPFPLVFGRVVIAALVLGLGMLALRRPIGLRAHARKLLVLALLNAALPFSLVAAAELRLTASFAAILNSTVPLWGALFGVVWLGERIGVRRSMGLLLGLVGVAVLVGWSGIARTPADLLSAGAMLVATASYAAAGVYTKRELAGVPSATLALGQQVAAALWLALPALWQLPQTQPTQSAALALVALALLSTTIAYLFYFQLIASVGPTKTNTVTYLLPIFGTLWGVIFLREQVTANMLAGLALILGSVLMVNDVRWRRRAAPRGASDRSPVDAEALIRKAARDAA